MNLDVQGGNQVRITTCTLAWIFLGSCLELDSWTGALEMRKCTLYVT